ncbi:hypothetical protein N1851_033697 [Merluccius polli]|uniref:HMG domain-containing protein n=1 Tax=Merluccius polli TaxID=89951 RepID=A0AA47M0U1_MERPO|nr:hypothetical protein N1851_033697 [Merluccius polli]
MSCVHKNVAKWHLFHTEANLFRRVRTVKDPESSHRPIEEDEDEDEENAQYPPEGNILRQMLTYIFEHKKIPTVLPPDKLRPDKYPEQLFPSELFCMECPAGTPLSEAVLITSKAKILTVTNVIEGISTYRRNCHRCGMIYRYQEWTDGVHNFDDHILISHHLSLYLRNSLQTHQAVGSAIEVLQETSGKQFPSKQRMLQAYLSFEALTEHTYNYSCVSCDHHPSTVIMDLHKKGVFNMPVSSIEDPPPEFQGRVSATTFWDMVSLEMLSRGLVPSNRSNPFVVPPSFHNWAPWVGPHTRASDDILNTEYCKVMPAHPPTGGEFNITEDRLIDELLKLKTSGIDHRGSRMDLVLRLQKEMKSRATYDKVFSKIWGASGGWAVVTCPCGIIYGVKFNLRAESPRDFTDILMSMAHLPNVCLYDFARGLASHANGRQPLTFSPNEGRLLPSTEENVKGALEGRARVSLPWLLTKKAVPDKDGHPVTGSSEHYALYDRFHESNTKDPRDSLRKVELVPELRGWVNSQCAEQLFSGMRKKQPLPQHDVSLDPCLFNEEYTSHI